MRDACGQAGQSMHETLQRHKRGLQGEKRAIERCYA